MAGPASQLSDLPAFVPAIGTCLSRMTGDEKRFAQRL